MRIAFRMNTEGPLNCTLPFITVMLRDGCEKKKIPPRHFCNACPYKFFFFRERNVLCELPRSLVLNNIIHRRMTTTSSPEARRCGVLNVLLQLNVLWGRKGFCNIQRFQARKKRFRSMKRIQLAKMVRLNIVLILFSKKTSEK